MKIESYRVTTIAGRVIADCPTSEAAWAAYRLLRRFTTNAPRLYGPEIPNTVQIEPGALRGTVNDELRQAIATFVGACARFCLGSPSMREQRRLEVHAAFDALVATWGEGP